MGEQMRALCLRHRGGPENLRYEHLPRPTPGIGDVLVQVDAASLTPTELSWPSTWVDRRGAERLPVVPCHEMCGQVVELGYGTSGFEVGDEVFGVTDWYRDGAAAEFVAVEARNLAYRPANCTAAEAAAAPLAGLTAWQALFDHGHLEPKESVMVMGATGGVGVFALQLARATNATVLAAGHADRAEQALSLGAHDFVDMDQPDWTDHDVQVDLAFDLVGGAPLDRLAEAGFARRIVSVVAPHEGVDFFVVEPDRRELAELAARIEAGRLSLVLSETLALEDGARAFDASSRQPGKRVLTISR